MTIYTLNLVKDRLNDVVEPIALCSSREIAAEMAVQYASDMLWLRYEGYGQDVEE